MHCFSTRLIPLFLSALVLWGRGNLLANELPDLAKAKWVFYDSSTVKDATAQRQGDIWQQTHPGLEGDTIWHTTDLSLPQGDFVFRAIVRTDGTGANGGVTLSAQLVSAKRLIASSVIQTNGKWEAHELAFKLTEPENVVRFWVVQKVFRGTSEFRRPVLAWQARRTPYAVLSREFPEGGEARLDCEPNRTYQVRLKNADSVNITFLDQDWQALCTLVCQDGSQFTAPPLTMLTRLNVNATDSFVEVTESPEAARSFDWNYWNSWNMVGPLSGGSAWRDFELKQLPEYAVGRFPVKAEVLVNGVLAGEGCTGYTDKYYLNLKQFLQTGQNRLELRFPAREKSTREILAADVEFRFSDASRQVLLASSGTWQTREPDGTVHPIVDFRPSWHLPELFDKNWIVPSAIPFSLLPPCPVKAELALDNSNAKVGEQVCGTLSLHFTAMPFFQTSRLGLRILDGKGKQAWLQWIFAKDDLTRLKAGDSLTLPFALCTDFLTPGRYSIHLDERLASASVGSLEITAGQPPAPRPPARFVRQGCMDCIVCGEFSAPAAIYYTLPNYGSTIGRNMEDDCRMFADAGFKVFSLPCHFGFDLVKNGSQGAKSIWLDNGKYDFSSIDIQAERLLASVPDARMILRIDCSIPSWWQEKHPEESVVWDEGTRNPGFPSLASERLRHDLSQALRDTATYVASRAWGGRILGFYALFGYDGQWFQPMDYGRQSRFADYSAAMQREFRAWLERAYHRDTDALRRAWGRPDAGFSTVQIPSREARLGSRYYLDPVKERPAIDFALCTARQTEEVIALIATSVKEVLGDLPFGTYYIPGDTTYRNAQAQRPCIDGIYDERNYNYAASPLGYDCNGVDQKGMAPHLAVNQTQRLHNVFYIGEDDSRTYLSMIKNPRWGNPDAFGTLAGRRRNTSKRLTTGMGFWYFDIWGHWYSSPALQEHFRREIRLMQEMRNWSPLPELDAQAVQVLKPGVNLHKRMNTAEDLAQVHFPAKTALPPVFIEDTVNLRDLGMPGLPRYRLYIFDDLFALDEGDRARIDGLKRDGATLLFTHATG
ncbi:MAG: beta-galactosidase, partial [Victivallales bacterium]|nr:beta-galactosidase [Victivallales bacterium]